MSGIPNISGSTSQQVSSGAYGGSLDTQGKFSFGGINNGSATQSYVAMGLIAVVALGALFVVMKSR